jgi:hypothetical protein
VPVPLADKVILVVVHVSVLLGTLLEILAVGVFVFAVMVKLAVFAHPFAPMMLTL